MFQVNITRWFNTSMKQKFTLEKDTYNHWVLLAADEGSFHYKIKHKEGNAKFGDIVLCPPQTTFYRRSVQPLSFLFVEFEWCTSDGNPITLNSGNQYGKISFHRTDRFTSTFKLIREIADMDHDIQSYKNHLLLDLLFLFELERKDQIFSISIDDPIIQSAVHFIRNNAYEPLSLKLLADEALLSQSQFSRRFQASMGVSPITYLTKIRMKKAQSLMLSTKLTLEEIALQCGYQNGFYLSRVFTNTYHMSPSEFRKMYRI